MPYLPFLDEEEKKKQQEEQNISGTSTVINPTSQDVNTQKPAKRSGSWTNLNTYLDANKEQSKQMAESIASNVEKKGQDSQQIINKVDNTQVNLKTLKPEEYLNTPQDLSVDSKKEYQDYRKTGGYLGPSKLEDVISIDDINQVNDASNRANALKSEEGRFATLQDHYKRPDYRQGQKVFDNLLLQGNESNRDRLKGVADSFGALKTSFDEKVNQKGLEINDKVAQANAQKAALQELEKKSWDDLLNPIKQRAQDETKSAQQIWGRVSEDIQDEKINNETMDLLGLRGGEELYDLNLSQFASPDLSERNLNNVANAEERAKYQALAALLEDPTRQEIDMDGSALSSVHFDKDSFERAQTQKRDELTGIVDNLAKTAMLDRNLPFVPGQPTGITDLSQLTPYIDALYENTGSSIKNLIDRVRAGESIGDTGGSYTNRIRDIVLTENMYKKLANPRRVMPALMKDLPEYSPGFNPKEV